jgi:hypothetical protein
MLATMLAVWQNMSKISTQKKTIISASCVTIQDIANQG